MDVKDLHALFLLELPRFEAHASFAFRYVQCPTTRDDLQAETIALAWKHFSDQVRKGKHPETFVTTLAMRCSQAVRAGRRLAGSVGTRDVLSPITIARHGYTVEPLSTANSWQALLSDALQADTRTPVPSQVAFRIDFPHWRSSFRRRERAVLDALACGVKTKDVASRFKVSAPWVSQLRRKFLQSWWAFHQEV